MLFEGTVLRSVFLAITLSLSAPHSASADVSPFSQALAIAAADDEAVATWFRTRNYAPFWTGPADADRRRMLLGALARADDHGLPVIRYDAERLSAAFREARTEGDRGRLEVAMTRAMLDFAHDLQSGALTPGEVAPGILRDVAATDRAVNLAAFVADPERFLAGLAPRSPVYLRLMKARLDLAAIVSRGGWGLPVPGEAHAPGDTGPGVVALRDRLVAMGYMPGSASAVYDADLQAAVLRFQTRHGLAPDGRANAATLSEINVEPMARLGSVLVAMERMRWMPDDLGRRHVWVNLPDFTARIVEGGQTTFVTRSVIGKNVSDRQTPEFSDEIEHMVINPSWNVPRSITTKEYLPLMQANPNAAGQLQLIDSRGRVVPRGAVNFGAYTARNFPFSMRQAPSDANALGLVKFMFPNPHNIYLHDTPSKSLFDKEVRDYSHGCIRLADPFDFAYALLSRQTDAPEATFKQHLNTGSETFVPIDKSVPVHLVYFTAWPDVKGRMTYRRDVYGRDAALLEALKRAGMAPVPVQG